MTEVKQNLFIFLLTVAHVCHGQFFYTDFQEAEKWVETHSGSFQKETKQQNIWADYLSLKSINKSGHSFGSFFHFKNGLDIKGVHQKSDLIGNGLMTNYQYKSNHFQVLNSMFLTYDMHEAERGFFRTLKNVTMYTNQAFFTVNHRIDELDFEIKGGRDFLTVGHGLDGYMFFGDYSRPFDQFTLKAEMGKFDALFSAIELDSIMFHNRYLYAHTFGYNSNKISITIGEGVLTTGYSKSVELKYLNPFSFWSWENVGSTNKGLNAFLYAGATYFPRPGLRIFGEFIIDDINFHQEDAFYLNRFGYLIGFQKTGYPFNSSNIWVEYSNVLNQVYQSYHPTHIYTHRGFPIGHYLGNDFINLRMHYSQLLKKGRIKPFIDVSYLMDGANGLDTPFDDPWVNEKGEFLKDYDPPSHPTPPINKLMEVELGGEINVRDLTYLTITAQYQSKEIENTSLSDFGLGIRFWSYLQFPLTKKTSEN